MFKKGDKVRIKTHEQIKSTLNDQGHERRHNVFFNPVMAKYCGRVYKVTSVNKDGNKFSLDVEKSESITWTWADHWLEPAHTKITLPEDLFNV